MPSLENARPRKSRELPRVSIVTGSEPSIPPRRRRAPGSSGISCIQIAWVRSGDQSQSTERGPPGGVIGVSLPRSIVVTVVGGGHVAVPSTNQIRAPAGSPVGSTVAVGEAGASLSSEASQPEAITTVAIARLMTSIVLRTCFSTLITLVYVASIGVGWRHEQGRNKMAPRCTARSTRGESCRPARRRLHPRSPRTISVRCRRSCVLSWTGSRGYRRPFTSSCSQGSA